MIHCRLTFNALMSTDTAEKNQRFATSIIDAVWETLNESSSAELKLAAAETDREFQLNTVALGKFVVAVSEKPFTIKVNSIAGTSIPVHQMTGADGSVIPGFIAFLSEGITKLYVTNPSISEIITVGIGVAGD